MHRAIPRVLVLWPVIIATTGPVIAALLVDTLWVALLLGGLGWLLSVAALCVLAGPAMLCDEGSTDV